MKVFGFSNYQVKRGLVLVALLSGACCFGQALTDSTGAGAVAPDSTGSGQKSTPNGVEVEVGVAPLN